MCVCFVIQLHHNNAKSPAYNGNNCRQTAASCLKQDATITCPRRQKSKRPTNHSHCRQQQAAKHTDTVSHQRTNNLKPVGHRVRETENIMMSRATVTTNDKSAVQVVNKTQKMTLLQQAMTDLAAQRIFTTAFVYYKMRPRVD